MDKMREEFEAFACMRTGGTAEEIAAERRGDSYLDEDLATGWFVWQASRESLVIDLDAAAKALAESMDYPWEFMPEQGRARMRANATMVIEAAGLKVAP